jgi:ribonuclease J
MKLTVYRGTKEIGGTLVEVKSTHTRILIDAGYPLFLNNKPIEKSIARFDSAKLLALGVLPQIKGLYKWDVPTFDAVLISHAHLDHYGLLQYIHPIIPVYLSVGTETIIKLSQTFKIYDRFEINSRNFRMYENFQIGEFTIKPFLMDHSAFDAAAFEIGAEGKTMIYTGDFRGHGRKAVCLDIFIQNASKQADALLIEGTMFGRSDEIPLRETDLEEEILHEIDEKTGPALFQCSSQNIDRLVTFYRASLRLNRVFVVDIYTANVLYELHKLGNKLPYPSPEFKNIRVFYPQYLTNKIFAEIGSDYATRFFPYRIYGSHLKNLQKKVIMVVRPSMYIDVRNNYIQSGLFYYSMWQGYRSNEKQIKFEKDIEELCFDFHYLHTSGHASITDIKRVITGLNPKKIIPIHTLFPNDMCGISDNTEIMEDGIELEI